MPEPSRRVRRFPKLHKPDGESGKRQPHSLGAVLRAIRRLWEVPRARRPRTHPEFEQEFYPSFQNVIDLYPAWRTEAKDLTGLMERLERGDCEICYYHLRAYAEFVGVPTALLLIFSHLVGDAAKNSSRTDLLALLDQYVTSVTALRAKLGSVKKPTEFLLEKNPTDTWPYRYNARIGALEALVSGFRSGGDPDDPGTLI